MENTKLYINYIARLIEALGVIAIAFGFAFAFIRYFLSLRNTDTGSYKILRQNLGKAILLGLEILVAGDIIGTVVTEPTMDRVLSLAVIVLIRTFLSLSIQTEIEGKVPWKTQKEDTEVKQLS